MKIYLAAPMRRVAEFNHPSMKATAAKLRAAGHVVFNPAEHDDAVGFDPTGMTGHEDLTLYGFDLRATLAVDVGWICLHADAVALMPGWSDSSGARAEKALAEALGLRLLYLDGNALVEALDEERTP